jgi:hypothetical protein
LKNEQRPPRQSPEQQLPLLEHTSPRLVHDPPRPAQDPFTHSLLQQAVLDVHERPAAVHVDAVEHLLVAGSQKSEQHSLDSPHVAPAALHWFGPLQRFTPSTSTSQWLSQQSPSCVQVSPVGLHDVAGTSQRPFTQLSEQQSVSFVQLWWKFRHVAQLTPTSHAVPKQQPFEHVVLLHVHWPPTHACPLAQAGPAPQVHWPPALHPSASLGSHATQTPLPCAHVFAGGAVQVAGLPVQQPVGHVAAQPAHVPDGVHVQVVLHAVPPVPQAPFTLPGWQCSLASQQPLGQLVGSHTQDVPLHS